MMDLELTQQGAEARIYSGTFQGRPCIVKERFAKAYRHPALDSKLRQRRTAQEVRSVMKCRKCGIATPTIFFVNYDNCIIYMENLYNFCTLRDVINQCQRPRDDVRLREIAGAIGETIAKMHDVDVIHGDLTTSNIMLSSDSKTLKVIDFGLSSVSALAEDKGVDLYVLERAFLSTHPNTDDLFRLILEIYENCSKRSKSVIAKLDEVRLRGRKRTMVG